MKQKNDTAKPYNGWRGMSATSLLVGRFRYGDGSGAVDSGVSWRISGHQTAWTEPGRKTRVYHFVSWRLPTSHRLSHASSGVLRDDDSSLGSARFRLVA